MIEKIAYIGPGGPEFVVLLLVVLLLFGAKDAPRVLRKMNETYHKLRKKIDKFKREIMYGDLNQDTSSSTDDTYSVDDEDYGYDDHDHDDDYMDEGEDQEREYSDETFQNLEKDLEEANPEPVADEHAEHSVEEPVPEAGDEEDDHAEKA